MIEVAVLWDGREKFSFAAPSETSMKKNGSLRVRFSVPGPEPFFTRDVALDIENDGHLSVRPAAKRAQPIFELRPHSECSYYSGEDALHMYVGDVIQQRHPDGLSIKADYSLHQRGMPPRETVLKIFIRR